MSKANGERMGQSLNYQSYLAKYVWYLIRCPTKGRPRDCVHPCPRYIHSGQCKPCTQFVELECYCEATGIVKPCKEWCDMGEEQKQLVKCCRVRCAKIMECGHQCPLICHPGRCADSYQCVENVMRYCNCERIERVFPCRGRGAKDQMVQCDHVCAQLLKTYKQAIAEMKNNPVKLTKGLQEADGNGSTANAKICTENAAVEEIKRILTGVSLSHDAKHESQSESGFNANKTEGDDQTEADAKGQQPHTEEATAVQDEAEICTGRSSRRRCNTWISCKPYGFTGAERFWNWQQTMVCFFYVASSSHSHF
ncbi:NF-X1-type zinc finger protein NFXL2-like isoform X2 [Varroa jacobsoni]|uniref:NF-X1-type zinc finger protein NFXL2-like isoform X2 n=1 Tax=Varroa jacobsoni TaxID=62625 RepID=UPI000BFA0B06|nr:NF-X1-type zinc finger protein NFXL2-like isoform X2 [Varroa jacobsoni]